ncbi:P-loop containing nucleoside triphosphate hydrolase protein, partial [Syncephalis pseudoplumigaleata]
MSDFGITATFKLLLIGNTNVGKSSILLRFTDDAFLPPEEVSATIGVDFKVKVVEYEDRKYKLTIWDTAGQERFRTLTSSYYRGAQGVILVYDVTNRDTFEELGNWLQELNLYTNNGNIVKMIVGNKVDKESDRVVSREEGQALAEQLGTLFVECSAKTRQNINTAMEQLVGQIVNTPELWQK